MSTPRADNNYVIFIDIVVHISPDPSPAVYCVLSIVYITRKYYNQFWSHTRSHAYNMI